MPKNAKVELELLDGNNLSLALKMNSQAIWFAFAMLREDIQEAYEDENFDPDFEKIATNQDQFKTDLFNALMSASIDEFQGTSLNSIIDQIYNIVKGIQSGFVDWDTLRIGDVAVDRAMVIASIECSSPDNILVQKTTWLKEWINEASDSEVQSFLKFATGYKNLAESSKIHIDGDKKTPFIEASTCNMTLHMSSKMQYNYWGRETWDNTKEGFVRNLEFVISEEGFQNL